jgi:2-polyprenyl-3-methyl-5-hydroxy-6-metoxy-1,4-benzoquinol methylase
LDAKLKHLPERTIKHESHTCPVCGCEEYLFLKPWANGFDALQCIHCSLIYSSQLKAAKGFYENTIFNGKPVVPGSQIHKRHLGWPYKKLLKHADQIDMRKSTIFEVGAGVGQFVGYLRSLGANVSGCDLSTAACAAAKEAFGVFVRNSSFEQCNMESESLDVLVAIELIEHLPCPLDFFKEAHRTLKSGGYFFLSTPNSETSWPLRWERTWGALPPFHLTVFSKRSLTFLASKTGFKIESFIQKPFPFRYEFGELSYSVPRLLVEAGRSFLRGEKGVTLFCVLRKDDAKMIGSERMAVDGK